MPNTEIEPTKNLETSETETDSAGKAQEEAEVPSNKLDNEEKRVEEWEIELNQQGVEMEEPMVPSPEISVGAEMSFVLRGRSIADGAFEQVMPLDGIQNGMESIVSAREKTEEIGTQGEGVNLGSSIVSGGVLTKEGSITREGKDIITREGEAVVETSVRETLAKEKSTSEEKEKEVGNVDVETQELIREQSAELTLPLATDADEWSVEPVEFPMSTNPRQNSPTPTEAETEVTAGPESLQTEGEDLSQGEGAILELPIGLESLENHLVSDEIETRMQDEAKQEKIERLASAELEVSSASSAPGNPEHLVDQIGLLSPNIGTTYVPDMQIDIEEVAALGSEPHQDSQSEEEISPMDGVFLEPSLPIENSLPGYEDQYVSERSRYKETREPVFAKQKPSETPSSGHAIDQLDSPSPIITLSKTEPEAREGKDLRPKSPDAPLEQTEQLQAEASDAPGLSTSPPVSPIVGQLASQIGPLSSPIDFISSSQTTAVDVEKVVSEPQHIPNGKNRQEEADHKASEPESSVMLLNSPTFEESAKLSSSVPKYDHLQNRGHQEALDIGSGLQGGALGGGVSGGKGERELEEIFLEQPETLTLSLASKESAELPSSDIVFINPVDKKPQVSSADNIEPELQRDIPKGEIIQVAQEEPKELSLEQSESTTISLTLGQSADQAQPSSPTVTQSEVESELVGAVGTPLERDGTPPSPSKPPTPSKEGKEGKERQHREKGKPISMPVP